MTKIDLQLVRSWKSEMVATLIAWCNTNSGSYNRQGLADINQKICALFANLDVDIDIEQLPGHSYQKLNDNGELITITSPASIKISNKVKAQTNCNIVLCGHMDTVFTADSHFQNCQYLADDIINGPGVADMKGGLLVIYYALKAYTLADVAKPINWTVLIVADEEIGSFGSTPHLKQIATDCSFGLIYEPSLEDGSFVASRKGSGLFSLKITGKTAHAGREPERGRKRHSQISPSHCRHS